MPVTSPPTPALSLRRDGLDPLILRVTETTRKPELRRKHFSDVVDGRTGISRKMAIRLDKAFRGRAHTWLHGQAACGLAGAMRHADLIKVEPWISASQLFSTSIPEILHHGH